MDKSKITFWTLILSLCCVCVLAGYALFSVTVSNQNSDIANLELQIQEYENNLTLTRAELIIAQEEREELVTTVLNYEAEVIELRSQAVIDAEKLATAEANLATAEQALEAKDAEIVVLEQDINTYELVCGIGTLDTVDLVTLENFDFTYDNYSTLYLTETIKNDDWVYMPFSDNTFIRVSDYGFTAKGISSVSYSSGSYISLSDLFDYVYNFSVALCDLDIKLVEFHANVFYTSYSQIASSELFNPLDFVEQVDSGILDNSNWCDFFGDDSDFYYVLDNGYITYSSKGSVFGVSKWWFVIPFTRASENSYNDLTSISFCNKTYSLVDCTSIPCYNLMIDEKLDVENICIFTTRFKYLINKSFESLCIADQYLWNSITTSGSSDYISFGEGVYIDCLYLASNWDASNIKEDILSKIGRIEYLPFSASQIISLQRLT